MAEDNDEDNEDAEEDIELLDDDIEEDEDDDEPPPPPQADNSTNAIKLSVVQTAKLPRCFMEDSSWKDRSNLALPTPSPEIG